MLWGIEMKPHKLSSISGTSFSVGISCLRTRLLLQLTSNEDQARVQLTVREARKLAAMLNGLANDVESEIERLANE